MLDFASCWYCASSVVTGHNVCGKCWGIVMVLSCGCVVFRVVEWVRCGCDGLQPDAGISSGNLSFSM